MSEVAVLDVLNGLICAVAFWGCLCRLNHMTADTKLGVRAYHSLLLGVLAASGGAPALFGQSATFPQFLLGVSVLSGMMASLYRWRHRAPEDTLHKEYTL